MIKLMKYEIKKQFFIKIVILVLAIVCQLLIATGLILYSEDWVSLGEGLFVILAFVGFFIISFETIITFESDLKNKWGYMLFLTPHTSYQIVGSKLITAAIQIIAYIITCFLIILGNIFMITTRFEGFAKFAEIVKQLWKQVFNSDLAIKNFIEPLSLLALLFFTVVTLSYLAITISATILAGKKYNGFVSFILFLVISIALDIGMNKILNTLILYNYQTAEFILRYLFLIIICVASYFGTSYLLEKKVSL